MHSRRTLNIIPSVLLLQFTWSLAQASDSIQSLHAPRDRRRFRVPRQHLEHFCTGLEALCSMFASTNSSSFKISSECPTPPVSAAFNSSARSPPIPDTAVLIFHDQFCHRSSPPRALRCYRIPSCSNAVAVTASRSQQFGVPLVTVESCLAFLVQRTPWSRRHCLRSVNDVPAFAAAVRCCCACCPLCRCRSASADSDCLVVHHLRCSATVAWHSSGWCPTSYLTLPPIFL